MGDVNHTNLMRDRAAFHACAIASNVYRDGAPDLLSVARSVCGMKIDEHGDTENAMDHMLAVADAMDGIASRIRSIMMEHRSAPSAAMGC